MRKSCTTDRFRCLLLNSVFVGFLLLVPAWSMAQVRVSGKVTDASTKQGVPAATVIVKGTTHGVSADLNGNYSLEVPNAQSVLTFSSLGYSNQEWTVGAQTVMNVALVEDAKVLDDVVVVGYGTQNKRDVTGSIAKIDGEALMISPAGSFDAALQGRAPGVQVIQSSGMAGAGAAIRVRGMASITAGGDPLIVIDGIPIQQNAGNRVGATQENPLSSINPNDIESIDILKDASATAIYGSRGANGVMLITTKRGKQGGIKVNVSSRVAFAQANRKIDMLETDEYLALYKEAMANDWQYGTDASRPNPATWAGTYPGGFTEADARKTNTNWQDEVTRTGVSTFNDVSVSGGNKKIQGYLGLSHVNENSYVINDHFERSSIRMNLDYTPAKWFKVGTNINLSKVYQNSVSVGWEGGLGTAISNAMPYYPVYKEGTKDYYLVQGGATNAVARMNENTRKIFSDRFMGNVYLDFTMAKDLSLRIEGNLDNKLYKSYSLATRVLASTPSAGQNNRFEHNWNAKALLNYALNIGDDHRLTFLVGTEALKSVNESRGRNVRFIVADGDQEGWLFNKPDYQSNNETFSSNPAESFSFISFFGRINYSFKDRYMLTATYRRDGSSRFGQNNKFGDFPAVSVGWLLTEENFLKDNPAVSLLKLKVGYGKTGNAEIPNYAQWGTISVNPNQLYNGSQYWYINRLKNPDLKWETTQTFDVAVEYGFLKNRITGEIAYYNKESKDLFLNASVPASSGFSSFLYNIGKVRNSGVEFSIRSVNIAKKDFNWVTDFNISYNKNKVLDVGGAGVDALGGEGDTRVIKGQPIGVNYLVKTLYIDPADGMPVFQKLDANKKPIGETKVYSADDRQPLGHPYSDFVGGLDNKFTYKNWDFGVMFTFQIGGNIYDDAEKFQMNQIQSWNQKSIVKDRWQKPGDKTNIPRLTLGKGGTNQSRNTSEYLHDAGYLRLKNLSAGYTFTNKGLRKIHLSSINVYVQATNLFTFFNEYYSKFDGEPEIMRDVASAQARNLSANVTYLSPPQARTFSLGVKLNF